MSRRRSTSARPEPVQEPLTYEQELAIWTKQRNMLRIRRAIVSVVVLAVLWGIGYALFCTDIAAPFIGKLQPVIMLIQSAWNDPKGALMIVATLVASHMGILALIFDDRNI